MSSHYSQKSGLLDLPYEIRIMVHKHVFSGEDDYLHISIEYLKHQVREVSLRHGFLLTCKQIYREAIKLYHASLAHLVIQFQQIHQIPTILGLAHHSTSTPLSRLFTVLNRLHISTQRRDSLRRITHLTISASIAPGVLWQCLQLNLLPAVEVVELVDECAYDICSDSFHNAKEIRGPTYFLQQLSCYDLVASVFNPDKHIARSRFVGWAQLATPSALTHQHWTTKFQMLWATHARWHFLCSASSFTDPVAKGQRSWLGSCYVVDFAYTYDCGTSRLTKFNILSQNRYNTQHCSCNGIEECWEHYLSCAVKQCLNIKMLLAGHFDNTFGRLEIASSVQL